MPKRYTRLEKRELVNPDGEFANVLEAALELHGYSVGSSEWFADRRKLCIKFLKVVLRTWDWTKSCRFDWLVHRLIKEALYEAGERIPVLKPPPDNTDRGQKRTNRGRRPGRAKVRRPAR